MTPFTSLTAPVAFLDRANVDTDQIIPKQFLKRVERTGFGEFLFFDWRFNADGTLNVDFELNTPDMAGAGILVAGKNFGSGSSREHAPWALMDYGFRVIIAPSFADIFYNNCFKNGLLPIVLDDPSIELLRSAASGERYVLTVDLQTQSITDGKGIEIAFLVDAFRRHCLLNGLDDIGLTLEHADDISAYESMRPSRMPSLAGQR